MTFERHRTSLGEPPSAAPPLHEVVDRWAAHQRRVREACVCGGPDIQAASPQVADINAAVQRHQIEPVHIAYDLARGIALSPAQLRASALDGDLTEPAMGGR